MGQKVVGEPGPSGCLPVLGLMLVGVVLVALICWFTLADWS